MRIAQFIDSLDIGGAESMLINLSRALIAQGHDVIVFHFGNTFIENSCVKYGIDQIIIPYKNLYNSILTIIIFSLRFSCLLRKQKVDILHSHLYGSITGAFIGTFIFRIPHVGTLHDKYTVHERLGRGLLLRMVQFADTRLVVVSDDMGKFYENHIPFCRSISRIYNGFNSEDQGAVGIPLPGLEGTCGIRVVTVGRLIKIKRQLQELIALSRVIKEYNFQLLFVGDGPEHDVLAKQIEIEGLDNNVHLLGERDDVYSILKCSDIFILASSTEGLSCSIIEAMFAGLPSVVSNVGGNGELIKHGINGFIFETNDANQLESLVISLICDSKMREQMGRRSRVIAISEFSSDKMGVNYAAIYHDIVCSVT